MDVQIGTSRFAPVPDELEPLVRAYAGLQGRSVTRAPSGVLEISGPPPGRRDAGATPAAVPDLAAPQPLLRMPDGCWTSPRARALLDANRRE
jgi:hypothetical protein